MEVKEAVRTAKQHIVDLYDTENINNVGLEEVELVGGVWSVTVGFSRPWDYASNLFGQQSLPRRTYKIVTIDNNDGEVLSIISHSINKQA